MARKSDLMGLGENPFLAALQATEPTLITAVGGSAASAFQLGPTQFLAVVTASNSGAGVRLPPVGGPVGCLLGDDFIVNNQAGQGSVTVYGPPGSSFSGNTTNTLQSGSGGVTVASHTTATFWPVTASTWVCLPGT